MLRHKHAAQDDSFEKNDQSEDQAGERSRLSRTS
jgi:hypothetical protein